MRKSARYWRLFAWRFVSYFSILISIVWLFTLAFPIITAEFNYRRDQLFGVHYSLEPEVTTSQGTGLLSGSGGGGTEGGGNSAGFSQIQANVNIIKPASTDYGIVIEKINANAKVIPDVNPANERQYTQALAQGIAEAAGSTKPGQVGNLFVFSHSADGPFNISRYNAIFYLLKELEKGDKIVIFYQGRRFDYIVFDKTVVDPKNTEFLTNRYDKPVLTLQTCDPPGTLNNRLIVRAQLQGS